ncbi:CubicO group peptidase (beta-lactamase class C family) [Tumebacillus sp. BK434]|uniref:serine hydrolase domain-containing protein n=1 Tax=Tumebacillus sp. BK434 TaxID=2512169 RepID=UPI001052AC82|nr:serine hydrolase domain-containing protein [Tumebacillus sp. BK434]TCP53868.1 CubicO group peptidase (beta-lactamase class C family) [Tumebacillus sp. BK434]
MRDTIMQGVAKGMFPGAVVCVARNGDPLFFEAHGESDPAQGRAMSIETRFDISTLTKVVATLPAVLRTVQLGKCTLVDPVARFLPELATGVDRHAKGQITLFHLLSHASGLPAWKPLFLEARGVKAYLRAMADTPLEAVPGERLINSDLGYMLLAFALERIWDRPFAEVCERLVFGPLELYQTSFAEGDGLPPELCAVTEPGNEQEQRRVVAAGRHASFPWRDHVLCGEAQDGNAFYGLDGVAGHAGLFSTALDLTRYAEMWVRKGIHQRQRYLDTTLVSLAVNSHAVWQGQRFGLGWETAAADCPAGERAPLLSYGQLSTTGCSLWCDPVRKLTSVILTNAAQGSQSDGLYDWTRAVHKRVFND